MSSKFPQFPHKSPPLLPHQVASPSRPLIVLLLFSMAIIVACGSSVGCNRKVGIDEPASSSAQSSAQEPDSATDKSIALFDSDFETKWQRINFGGSESHDYQPGQVTVEMGRPLSGIRYTADDFPKCGYRLQLEAKKVQGTDFFCCLTFPVKDSFCSLVIGGWGGTVTGISCIDRMDASDNPTTTIKKYEQNQWYAIRVEVTDDRLACWIDDQQIVDQALAGIDLSTRIEVSPCEPLGLCSFETESTWKNLRYEILP